MSVFNQSPREIELTVTGTIPTDALEAALSKIKEVEQSYFLNPEIADYTDARIILTGKTPYKVYDIAFTSIVATGNYTVVFNGVAPNTESL